MIPISVWYRDLIQRGIADLLGVEAVIIRVMSEERRKRLLKTTEGLIEEFFAVYAELNGGKGMEDEEEIERCRLKRQEGQEGQSDGKSLGGE